MLKAKDAEPKRLRKFPKPCTRVSTAKVNGAEPYLVKLNVFSISVRKFRFAEPLIVFNRLRMLSTVKVNVEVP